MANNNLLDFYLELLNIKNNQVNILKDIQLQLQRLEQNQTQTQTDTDTISNVVSPTINMNVPSSDSNLVRASAFRAINNTIDQPLPINFVKVLFPVEQFDLANEYDSTTSTFTAKTAGVYSLSASVEFSPNIIDVPAYEVRIAFVINNAIPSADADYTGVNHVFFNAVEINDIVQLNAGDTVEVFAASTTPGVVSTLGLNRFAIARFPSPIT